MRRLLVALALLASLLPTSRAQTSPEFKEVIERSIDSVYMVGVVRRNGTGPEVFQFVGTAWVIAEGKLATNAHVAESLLEASIGNRIVARRSWSDRDELALSPGSIRIHPAYIPWNARLKRVIVRHDSDPSAARSMNFIPIADVATVEVAAGETAPPLVLSDPSKSQPGLSESVVYLGFPYENISGFPTLHAVPGYITAKTDFFFQRVPWKDSYLIHYCGPVVGGASGSPILNSDGEVIGLVSAAENNLSVNGERTSFGFAYGQRVDLVRELLQDDFAAVQAARDGVWCERLAGLLLPPDELLEQMASAQAQQDGIQRLEPGQRVLRKEVTVAQREPTRIPVTVEAGQRYGFLAAAHDGSNIDTQVTIKADGALLGSDVAPDYFPVIWLGPYDTKQTVQLEIHASEVLLRDTLCSVHVYRYEPQLITSALQDESGPFFTRSIAWTGETGQTMSWRFAASPESSVMFSATSTDGYDIDLAVFLDGEILGSDETPDNVPIVIVTAPRAGVIELQLRVPEGTPEGATIEVNALHFSGPKPALLREGEDSGTEHSAEELSLMLDEALAGVWNSAGVTGDTVTQDVFALTGTVEFQIDVPAGHLPVLAAVAPNGEDIDMALLSGTDVLAIDQEEDARPLCATDPVDVARKLTVQVTYANPEATIPQVAFRYCTVKVK